MKKMVYIIVLVFLVGIVFCSCSNQATTSSNIKEKEESGNITAEEMPSLPSGYTIEKIKKAYIKYINYRLWLYPDIYEENTSPRNFDKYIGKSIDAEIRVYNDSVYIYTNSVEGLAVIKNVDGLIYCDGQVDFNSLPRKIKKAEYKIVEKYSVVIPEPLKPDYGKSVRKKYMINMIEDRIKISLKDYASSDESWNNVDVYIADFFEYQMATHAWLCKEDGVIRDFPAFFEWRENEIAFYTGKGYEMHIDNLEGWLKYFVERTISEAVRSFKWNKNQAPIAK